MMHDVRRQKRDNSKSLTGSSGQTLLFFCLLLPILILFVGAGLDIGRSLVEASHLQGAADSAAQAAVSAATGTGPNSVQSAADLTVRRNMPLLSGASVSDTTQVTIGIGGVASVRVRVTESNYPYYFLSIIGLRSTTISRSAVAVRNVSPLLNDGSSTLGIPSNATTDLAPVTNTLTSSSTAVVTSGVSLSINGPNTVAQSGDPYSSLTVGGGSSTVANPWRPANWAGYNYRVDLPDGAAGVTYLQVYDAGTCTGPDGNASRSPFGDQLRNDSYGVPSIPSLLPYNAAPLTYQPPPYAGYLSAPTYYRLYALDPQTGITATLPAGSALARGPGSAGAPLPPDVVIAPTEGISGTGTTCDAAFSGKWYTLGTFDASHAQSLDVNVTTCLDPSTPGSNGYTFHSVNLTNCNGTETNNFSLRAITVGGDSSATCGTGAPDCQSVTANSGPQPAVFPVGIESINLKNMTGKTGTTMIPLGQLPPNSVGGVLRLKIYDPGNSIGGSSLQVVRPDGSYAPMESYAVGLDGNNQPYTTTMSNNGSTSMVTSYPASGLPPNGCGKALAGTVGCWTFNEGEGPFIDDGSENGNVGKLYGGATFGTTSVRTQYGGTLTLDGSSGYVDVTTPKTLNIGQGDLSIAAWVNLSNNGVTQVIAATDDGTNGGYRLSEISGGEVAFYVTSGGGVNSVISPSGSLSVNQWNHIVAVYSRATGTITLYVNGAQVGQQTGALALAKSTADFIIGRSATSPSNFFQGQIDNLQVYNRALSSSEVATLATP